MAENIESNETDDNNKEHNDDESLMDNLKIDDTKCDNLQSTDTRYSRSISSDSAVIQQQRSIIKQSISFPDDCLQSKTETNMNGGSLEFEKCEEKKQEYDNHPSIFRLLEPTCNGIRERIELLGELIMTKKLDSLPDVYDEMTQIIAATERNQRLQEGSEGERLLEFTTAAKSNRNIDLHNLDEEIQRQFGLHSVEVTGDGSCAFRAILISGMQKPDFYYNELREKVIDHVLYNIPYYSTVLRPGETVSEKELIDWANSMTDPNTYADELANIAVADRYHVQLVIFRAGELLTVVNPRDQYVEHTAFLVNVGTHYKALVPRNELDEARKHSERLCK